MQGWEGAHAQANLRSNINSKFRDQQVLVLRTKSSLDIFITLDSCRRVKPRQIRHHTCLLSMIIHITKLLALLKCTSFRIVEYNIFLMAQYKIIGWRKWFSRRCVAYLSLTAITTRDVPTGKTNPKWVVIHWFSTLMRELGASLKPWWNRIPGKDRVRDEMAEQWK